MTTTTLVLLSVGLFLGGSVAAASGSRNGVDRVRAGVPVAVAVGAFCAGGAWTLAAFLTVLAVVLAPRSA